MNEEQKAQPMPDPETPSNPDAAQAKAICAVTFIVAPGGQGVQIRTAPPGPGIERAATPLDIRGICTEVLHMLQGQMAAHQTAKLFEEQEARAQAQADGARAIAEAQKNGGFRVMGRG